MFVPFIPIANHIVNKTVVYCDTVIPIQNMGKDIKIFTLENINSYNYKDCINKVCETNPDVLFHTIQYSAEKKQVTFYTDVVLNLDGYNDWKKKSSEVNYGLPGQNKLVSICENIISSNESINLSLLDYYKVLNEYHAAALRNVKRLREIISDKFMYFDESRDYQVKYEDSIKYSLSKGSLHLFVDYKYRVGDKCEMVIKKTNDGKLYLEKSFGSSIVPVNDLFNYAFQYIFELYEFLHDYHSFMSLIPQYIFFANGLVANVQYTRDYFSIVLSTDTFFPKKHLKAKDNEIKIVGLDYYSLQKIDGKQYEIFDKINVPLEEIKNISFIFDDFFVKKTKKVVKKESIWQKIKNFF